MKLYREQEKDRKRKLAEPAAATVDEPAPVAPTTATAAAPAAAPRIITNEGLDDDDLYGNFDADEEAMLAELDMEAGGGAPPAPRRPLVATGSAPREEEDDYDADEEAMLAAMEREAGAAAPAPRVAPVAAPEPEEFDMDQVRGQTLPRTRAE